MRDVRYRGALTVTRWRVQNLARSANTEQLILVYGAEGCATKTLRGDGIPVIVALPALVASHEDDRSLREGLTAPDLGGQQQQLVSALSVRGCELSRTATDCGTCQWATDRHRAFC